MSEGEKSAPPGRLCMVTTALRRDWILATLLLLALGCRVALPEVLRHVLVDQVPAALRGQVDIGDVDLLLFRGGFALDDVAIRSIEGGPPLIAWRRLFVRISWTELVRRTLLFPEILLVEPCVDLERLADGSVNLAQLIPAETWPVAEESAPERSSWRFALERFRIESGRLSFEDAAVESRGPVQVEVDDLMITGGAFGADFEGQVSIEARLRVEGAPLRVEARLEPGDGGALHAHTRLEAEGLPLRHAIAYSPYGWEDLQGRLDAAVEWQIDAERSAGRGRMALREVEVRERGATAASARWKELEVDVDSLDVGRKEVRIARLRWIAPRIVLEPGEPMPLPILRRVVHEAIVEPATDAAKTAAEQAEPESWSWSVAAVEVEEMQLVARRADRSTELGVSLAVERLADPSEGNAPFTLELAPRAGTLQAEGEFRIAPLVIAADLRWQDLDLPALLATLPQPEVAALRSARSAGRLRIDSTQDGGLDLKGAVALDELSLEKALPGLRQLGWRHFEAAIDAISLPGVLAGAAASPQVALRSVRLDGARVALVREDAASEVGGAFAAPSGLRESPRDEVLGEAAGNLKETRVLRIDELAVARSELAFSDRTLTPAVRAEAAAIELTARGVVWPSVQVARELDLRMEGPAGARIRLRGEGSDAAAKLTLAVEELELVPFDAYARRYGGLTIEGGTADLETSVALTADRYESESQIVLHDLGLSGEEGEAGFEKRFGVPLGLALALLRDVSGDITLDLPVSGGRAGGGVGFRKVLTRILRRVLVNALASPLKLIGSVAFTGGAIGKFAVEPLPFLAGTSDLAPQAEERIGSLAAVLADRPEIALRLEGRIAASDLAALRRQESAFALADPQSNTARALAALADEDPAQAKAVRELLAAPAALPPGSSPPPALEELLATAEVSRDRLIGLGLDRTERVKAELLARPGVSTEQVEVRTGTGEVRAQQPCVVVKLVTRPGA